MTSDKTILQMFMFAIIATSVNTQTDSNCACDTPVNSCDAIQIAVDLLRDAARLYNVVALELRREAAEAAALGEPEAAAAALEAANQARAAAVILRVAADADAATCNAVLCCHSCCSSIYNDLDSIFDPNAPYFNGTYIKATPIECQSTG